jgi:cytochrome c biogenesis protein CcmG/thiol:disulfide interchange protein DsbE
MDNELVQTKAKHQLPVWAVGLIFVVLIGFLVVIGMGLRRSQSGPISIGQNVPGFSLITFDGDKYNTADLAGKVIVVNFWASWCKPCEQEAADLEAAWQYYKPGGNVVFLGIDYVDTEPEALGFINKFGITYPNGPDLRTEVSQMFRIQGVPETYIISREGKLTYVKKGPFESLAEIQAAIDPLLQ